MDLLKYLYSCLFFVIIEMLLVKFMNLRKNKLNRKMFNEVSKVLEFSFLFEKQTNVDFKDIMLISTHIIQNLNDYENTIKNDIDLKVNGNIFKY